MSEVTPLIQNAAELSMECVREFDDAFKVDQTFAARGDLVTEEHSELLDAAKHALKELVDVLYVCAGIMNQMDEKRSDFTAEETLCLSRAEAAIQLVTRVVSGRYFRENLILAVSEVHKSNMSKLVNGQPLKHRRTGKILKGPDYKEPDTTNWK